MLWGVIKVFLKVFLRLYCNKVYQGIVEIEGHKSIEGHWGIVYFGIKTSINRHKILRSFKQKIWDSSFLVNNLGKAHL